MRPHITATSTRESKDAHVLGAFECGGLLWLHGLAVLIAAYGFQVRGGREGGREGWEERGASSVDDYLIARTLPASRERRKGGRRGGQTVPLEHPLTRLLPHTHTHRQHVRAWRLRDGEATQHQQAHPIVSLQKRRDGGREGENRGK